MIVFREKVDFLRKGLFYSVGEGMNDLSVVEFLEEIFSGI